MKFLVTFARTARLAASAAAAMVCAGCSGIPAQHLVKEPDGKINLSESDLCLTRDGESFARMSGWACKKGDLAYINVPSDADKAGKLTRRYCDFDRELAQTMDVYGVLCYLRITPAAPKDAKS
jgi:hypothetical protein